MNDTVIQEIANQLGMAVDQAGAFIQTYLPQYAMLKAVNIGVPMIVFGIILIVVAVLVYRSFKSHKAECIESGYVGHYTFAEYAFDSALVYVTMIVYAVCLVLYVASLAMFVPEMIGWAIFPEAQLISDCMNAIKG